MSISTTTALGGQMAFRIDTQQDCIDATANPDGSPRTYRVADCKGLMLLVRASGKKVWRCKVQRDQRSTTLSLGYFPKLSLQRAEAARKNVKVDRDSDPAEARREQRRAARVDTFQALAEGWLDARQQRAHWQASTRKEIEGRLQRDVFPKFGNRPIVEIEIDEVADLISKMHDKRPQLAIAIKGVVGSIFDYAIATRRATMNPIAIMKQFLPIRPHGQAEQHHPHMDTIEKARHVLASVETRANLQVETKLAHRLMALTGCRKMEIVNACWSEVDLDAALWTIPAERMKGKWGKREAHIVALAPQAVDVFRAMAAHKPPVDGGRVFSIARDTINEAMQRAKAGMPPHGWRGTFSTIMNELDERNFRIVDRMLAHSTFRDSADTKIAKHTSEIHYNHAQYVKSGARHRVAGEWANLLLVDAPTAFDLAGQPKTTNDVVVAFRRAA